MRKLARLTRLWLFLASREAQIQLLTNWAGILFIIGKVIRFLLYFVFLFAVLSSVPTLAGYNREQVILFFLVFTLVDTITQFLFRGVYTFRFRVVSGEYDLDLLKPWPSFFRPIFGSADFLDFFTLVPFLVYFFWFLIDHHLIISFFQFLSFSVLLLNSLILGFAFHLFVCSVGIITLQVDHLVNVYRDLSSMARFPIDIYKKGVQYFLTFTIPVVILMTVPTKALLGMLTWPWLVLAFAIGGVSLWASLRFWRFALKRYSSASS